MSRRSFKRSDRPIASKNRSKLKMIYRRRDTSLLMQTDTGRTIKSEFAFKLTAFMDWCVSNMCLTSSKIGRGTWEGFKLYTWERCAKDTKLSLDDVKHCAAAARSKGWITSKQPREKYTGRDNREAWKGLASIKRVTTKYFKDIGLLEDFEQAKESAKKTVKEAARKAGISVKYFLTPITLLRKFRRERAAIKAEKSQKQDTPQNRETSPPKSFSAPYRSEFPEDPLIT